MHALFLDTINIVIIKKALLWNMIKRNGYSSQQQ
jgi:hypothetical protein